MLLTWSIYLALGVAAGIMAGLLGIGGGLILVVALVWLLPSQGVPVEAAMHVALATSLTSIVLTALSSAYAHHRRGSVLWRSVVWLVPGMLLGGLLGSAVATALPGDILRYFVSGYCFIAAAQLVFGKTRAGGDRADAPASPALTAAGVGIGGVAAVVGIGGGSMTVPLLIGYGARPVRAVGTSAACGFAIAVASALGYVASGHDAQGLPPGSIGYVYLPAAIGVALASVLAAPHGAALAHRLKDRHLQHLFAFFLALMGASVLAAALV